MPLKIILKLTSGYWVVEISSYIITNDCNNFFLQLLIKYYKTIANIMLKFGFY